LVTDVITTPAPPPSVIYVPASGPAPVYITNNMSPAPVYITNNVSPPMPIEESQRVLDSVVYIVLIMMAGFVFLAGIAAKVYLVQLGLQAWRRGYLPSIVLPNTRYARMAAYA
jgi:hypothetical protein